MSLTLERMSEKTATLRQALKFAAELFEWNASFLLQILFLACRQVAVVFLHTRNRSDVSHPSFPDMIIQSFRYPDVFVPSLVSCRR